MTTPPAIGRNVIHESSVLVVGWSMWAKAPLSDHVLHDDEDQRAAERAEEIGVDLSALDLAKPAAAAHGQVGEAVDRAVDQVLVDGAVDIGHAAAQPTHEVDESVDEVLVDPIHRLAEPERRL